MPFRRPVAVLVVLLAALFPSAALADYGDGNGYPDDPQAADTVPADDGATDTTYDDGTAAGDTTYDDGSGPDDAGLPATPVAQLPGLQTPPAAPPAPVLATIPPTARIPGTVAKLRTDGKAAIPRGAPKRVQALIAAANRIIGKPYKWGGGHARLVDSGYDCSGSVSYALRGGGLLAGSMVSGALARWAGRGHGRWITVYANKGHVYMEVAGLRLDTSPVGDPTHRMGVRWRPLIGRRSGFAVRHPAGL